MEIQHRRQRHVRPPNLHSLYVAPSPPYNPSNRSTIDSQFNLPSEVIITIDLGNSNNSNINAAEITTNGVNPQMGALVAQTFMDVNLNSTADKDAVSG
jgi:hypothetical protein